MAIYESMTGKANSKNTYGKKLDQEEKKKKAQASGAAAKAAASRAASQQNNQQRTSQNQMRADAASQKASQAKAKAASPSLWQKLTMPANQAAALSKLNNVRSYTPGNGPAGYTGGMGLYGIPGVSNSVDSGMNWAGQQNQIRSNLGNTFFGYKPTATGQPMAQDPNFIGQSQFNRGSYYDQLSNAYNEYLLGQVSNALGRQNQISNTSAYPDASTINDMIDQFRYVNRGGGMADQGYTGVDNYIPPQVLDDTGSGDQGGGGGGYGDEGYEFPPIYVYGGGGGGKSDYNKWYNSMVNWNINRPKSG